ncbi:LytR/AlgR family response regulator transcription factor [Maribacter algicola]|uniref:LytR/AlgR family response regulator transcription factor n=1 Tax=Meishania litoralis TaxID=3434685 RepID=A0ACC7LGH5_9FLAO
MIRCIIIEDQPPAQRVLKRFISEIGNIDLKGTFSDALRAMDFLKTEPIDLIFLDIHLPKISGIDFLKTLKHKPNIILTTAFSDYALESYDYDVVDYLLKPFSFERFVQAISKIPQPTRQATRHEGEIKTRPTPDVLFIKSGYELIKIEISNINYIRSDSDYTEIVTDERKYLSQEPLRHWTEYLDDNQFVRIHKSYIVNTTKIEKIVGNQIRLDKKTTLPIGRAFKEGFMKHVIK